MDNPKFLPPELLWILLAISGGIAKYLDDYIHGAEFSILKFIANSFVSGFSGYMSAEVMMLVYPSWVIIAAGVGGYVGVQAIDILSEVITKRELKIKLKKPPSK